MSGWLGRNSGLESTAPRATAAAKGGSRKDTKGRRDGEDLVTGKRKRAQLTKDSNSDASSSSNESSGADSIGRSATATDSTILAGGEARGFTTRSGRRPPAAKRAAREAAGALSGEKNGSEGEGKKVQAVGEDRDGEIQSAGRGDGQSGGSGAAGDGASQNLSSRNLKKLKRKKRREAQMKQLAAAIYDFSSGAKRRLDGVLLTGQAAFSAKPSTAAGLSASGASASAATAAAAAPNSAASSASLIRSSVRVLRAPLSLTGGRLQGHQVQGLQWLTALWATGSSGILADDMGLGKTIQVIALLAQLREWHLVDNAVTEASAAAKDGDTKGDKGKAGKAAKEDSSLALIDSLRFPAHLVPLLKKRLAVNPPGKGPAPFLTTAGDEAIFEAIDHVFVTREEELIKQSSGAADELAEKIKAAERAVQKANSKAAGGRRKKDDSDSDDEEEDSDDDDDDDDEDDEDDEVDSDDEDDSEGDDDDSDEDDDSDSDSDSSFDYDPDDDGVSRFAAGNGKGDAGGFKTIAPHLLDYQAQLKQRVRAHQTQRGSEGPHLVIVPTSTAENWAREFKKWCPSLSVLSFTGGEKERKAQKHAVGTHNVTITTYSLVERKDVQKALSKVGWEVLVLDEAHALKNAGSNRFAAVSELRAAMRLLLTGTPVQNDLLEFSTLLRLALPELFYTATTTFSSKGSGTSGEMRYHPGGDEMFMGGGGSGGGDDSDDDDDDGEGNQSHEEKIQAMFAEALEMAYKPELKEQKKSKGAASSSSSSASEPEASNDDDVNKGALTSVFSAFILRRTKDGVLSELPPKTRVVTWAGMTANQQTIADTIHSLVLAIDPDQGSTLCRAVVEGVALGSSMAVGAVLSTAGCGSSKTAAKAGPTSPSSLASVSPSNSSGGGSSAMDVVEEATSSGIVASPAAEPSASSVIPFFIGQLSNCFTPVVTRTIKSEKDAAPITALFPSLSSKVRNADATAVLRELGMLPASNEDEGGDGEDAYLPFTSTRITITERFTDRSVVNNPASAVVAAASSTSNVAATARLAGLNRMAMLLRKVANHTLMLRCRYSDEQVLQVARAVWFAATTARGAESAAQKGEGKGKGGKKGGAAALAPSITAPARAAADALTLPPALDGAMHPLVPTDAVARVSEAFSDSELMPITTVKNGNKSSLALVPGAAALSSFGSSSSFPSHRQFSGFYQLLSRAHARPDRVSLLKWALQAAVAEGVVQNDEDDDEEQDAANDSEVVGLADYAASLFDSSDFELHRTLLGGLTAAATPFKKQQMSRLLLPSSAFLDCGKVRILQSLLGSLKAKGSRALIFSQFMEILDILEVVLRDILGHKFLRIDGSVKSGDRQTLVDTFNEDESYLAFLLTTRAGGVGLNLVGADTAVIYDSDYNPTMDLQAEDRIYRIGQTRPVTVYRLLTKGTVEVHMADMASNKFTMATSLMALSETGNGGSAAAGGAAGGAAKGGSKGGGGAGGSKGKK